jgi:hypothetical protein
MKNLTLIYLLVLSGFFGMAGTNSAEKTILFTPRTVFISGETIEFSGEVNSVSNNGALSRVVYVELISATGQKINQTKITPENNIFSGSIAIPEDLMSGYFYLRAYTKWMRNGNTENYARVLVKIFNPGMPDLYPYPDSVISAQAETPKTPDPVSIATLSKTIFTPGEDLYIVINEQFSRTVKWTTLSLIPKGTYYFSALSNSVIKQSYKNDFYRAETIGPVLSGSVLVNFYPSEYHKLNVNILGEKDFISVLTDDYGHFDAGLPFFQGEKELFVMAAARDKKVEIQVDQDFCPKPMKLMVPLFTVSEEEKKVVLQLAQQAQIAAAWGLDTLQPIKTIASRPFYGTPQKTIDFDFYIQLDSLEQYFTDIPSWVQVKSKKGKRYFEIFNETTDLSINKPLVLVDWIPVDEADRVLALSPQLVKQIEIVNKPYWHGSELYAGVLNVLTRKGDFGNIRFAETGMFVNYQFLASPKAPAGHHPLPLTYWNSQLNSDEAGAISLKSPALAGIYWLLLQYVDHHGMVHREMLEFEVKD